MNIKIKKRVLQFIWWGDMPTIKFWKYGSCRKEIKPIFNGLYFGLFEFRFLPHVPDLKDFEHPTGGKR